MKKLLLIIGLISLGALHQTYAQEAVVIKEEGADGDLDVEKDVSELSFKERVHFGGGISGLSFGNPTSIGLSPMAGYQLTNQTVIGLGLTYQYYSINYGGATGKLTSNLLGERIFARHYVPALSQIVGQSYLTAQVENYSNLSSNSGLSYSNPVLVGIGIGSKIGLNLTLMYDLNYSSSYGAKSSPYGSAFVVQVGGFFF